MQDFIKSKSTFFVMIPLIFIIFIFSYQLCVGWPFVGKSYFLADQLDQILQLEYLLKGKWELLYGPYASGTHPPVFNLNGFTSFLFGIPAILGADPNQIHLIHMILYIGCVIPLFIMVRQEHKTTAYAMIVLLSISPIYWWGLTLFWINIFLVSYSILHFLAVLQFLRKPSIASYCCILITWLLALGIHTSPIVNLPLILVLTFLFFWKLIKKQLPLTIPKTWLVALAIIILSYILLELTSGFSNTQAILAHLSSSNSDTKDYSQGIKGAKSAIDMLFQFAGVKFSLFLFHKTHFSIYTILGITILSWGAFKWIQSCWNVLHGERTPFTVLWCCLPLLFLTQVLYFLAANRPLLSKHYIFFMVPYYAFIWATLVSAIAEKLMVKKEWTLALLGIVCVILANKSYTKYVDNPVWTYDNIKKSLKQICSIAPSYSSIGKPAFQGYRPYYENLFEYITNRHIDNCTAKNQENTYIVIPDRQGKLNEVVEYKGKNFILLKKYPPGIGLYQFVPL